MTRILLDTHALLWFVANDPALPLSARSLIEGADEPLVSMATAWEIAIKVKLGKLTLEASSAEDFFEEQMAANHFAYLSISPAHVFRAAALPLHHRDPFDRMLIAQAMAEGLLLVTKESFAAYGVMTAW